jgi:phosphotriesterase-related protein
MADAVVTTVLGDVSPESLGVTLPHEHLTIDLSCVWHPPDFAWQDGLVEAPLSVQTYGDLSLDPYVSRPNLVLDDVDVAVDEVSRFRDAGGGTVVDLTIEGISPRPAALSEISRRSGLHIVMGAGLYVRRAHPAWVAAASVHEIAVWLEGIVRHGFGDSGVRPGIIGEIGTSSPIHDDERRVLRAAARVQRSTGLALNIHVAIFGGRAVEVLDELEAAGVDLSRTVISHMDELVDSDYHRAVLRRGAIVEFDTFGSESTFLGSDTREPSDLQRVEALLTLLHEGWAERLLISQDVCTRIQLRRNGGRGYDHILRAIVPYLRNRGVDEDTMDTLLVRNPARILANPVVSR